MGVKLEKNGAEEPIFDYSKWSYKAQKEVDTLRLWFQQAGKKVDEADPGLTDKEFGKLVDKYEDYRQQIEFSMSRHIVSVPRDWLMGNAPEKLDWSKPDTLGWLRSDRSLMLQKAAADARSPEGISGN